MDNTTTKFEVVGNSSNYLSFNGTFLDIKSQTFGLDLRSTYYRRVLMDMETEL